MPRWRFFPALRIAAVLLIAAAAVAAGPAMAQEPQAEGAGAQPATADDIAQLIDKLEDPAARDRLIGELRLLLETQQQEQEAAAEPGLMESISEALGGLGESLRQAVAGIGEPRRAIEWLSTQINNPERRSAWIKVGWQLALAIGTGLVFGLLARLLLRAPRRYIEAQATTTIWDRMPRLAVRTVLDVLPIAAFGLAANATMAITEPAPAERVVMITAIIAVVIARAAISVCRMVLTPVVPTLRLIPVADQTAAYLYVWTRRLINVAVYGYFAALIGSQLGIPAAGTGLFLKLVGLTLTMMLVVLVLQNRQAVAVSIGNMGGPELAPRALRVLRNRIADIWHILAILYVAAIFIVWLLNIAGGFTYVAQGTLSTVLIVILARLAIDLADRAISRMFRVSDEVKKRFPFIEERTNRYLPVFRRIVVTVIEVIAAVAILQAWHLDVLGWLASDTGRDLLGRLLTIAVVLIISLIVWEFASGAINVYLDRKDEEGNDLVHSARVRTLLPLIRNVLLVVITVMAVMVTMSELGIDIAPLLAGAGVIGLAIGFGAQTLVKDFITGMFILFEDSIQVGDVATVGGKTGVVEGITVRTVRLRDLSGTVYTIPFSAVDTIDNLTKDFSYAVVDVGVAYREDVDYVVAVLRELGEQLRDDPEQGPNILEDLEVLGLNEFGDSAVMIRVRFKTRPIKQWGVKRAFNRIIKNRFDELGIEIPFPHQTIYFGVDQEGKAPPAFVQIQQEVPAEPADRRTGETKPPPAAASKPGASGKHGGLDPSGTIDVGQDDAS